MIRRDGKTVYISLFGKRYVFKSGKFIGWYWTR